MERNLKHHRNDQSEMHTQDSNKQYSHSRHHHPSSRDARSNSRADSPNTGNTPASAPVMFAPPVAKVTLPWGCGAFLGPTVTVPVPVAVPQVSDNRSQTSTHHSDKSSYYGDERGHKKKRHHSHHSDRAEGRIDDVEVKGHKKSHHHQRHHRHHSKDDDDHRSKHSRSRSKHGHSESQDEEFYNRERQETTASPIPIDPGRPDTRQNESFGSSARSAHSLEDGEREKSSEKYMSEGEIQSSCSNDDDMEEYNRRRRGRDEPMERCSRRGAVLYEGVSGEMERGRGRYSNRSGRGARGAVLLDDRVGYDDLSQRYENSGRRNVDDFNRLSERSSNYSSRDRSLSRYESDLRAREKGYREYDHSREYSSLDRVDSVRDLKRHGSYSDFGSLKTRSGALLIDDRLDNRPLGSKPKEKMLGRSGALLIEDKKDTRSSRSGAVLIEDRKPGRSGAFLIEDRDSSRSRAVLVEDMIESRPKPRFIDDRKEGRTGAVLIEDRQGRKTGRSGAILLEDGKGGRSGALLLEESRSGALLQEDRKQSRSGALLLEDRNERRSRTLLLEDRNDIRSGALLRDDRNESRSGTILREDRNDSRTGAVLREDRNDSRTGAVLREDRIESRSGALLIEDRGEGRSGPLLREERSESRSGAILREDRNESRSGAFLREDRNESRTGALLIDDRNESRSGVILRDDRIESRSGTVFREDRNENRSGVILRDDRIESRSGTVLREDRNESRTGALLRDDRNESRTGSILLENRIKRQEGRSSTLLIEDRSGRQSAASAYDEREESRSRSFLRGNRIDRTSRTGAKLVEERNLERRALSRDDMTMSGRGESVVRDNRAQGQRDNRSIIDQTGVISRRFEDSMIRDQGLKRSWSSSTLGEKRRRDSSRSQERDEIEGAKRRRRREPTPETSAPKCVRSGTPPVSGAPAEEDYYIAPPAAWVRCSAADLYFTRDHKTGTMTTTKRMQELENKFETDILKRGPRIRVEQEPYEKPKQLLPRWQQGGKCPEHGHSHGGHGHHHHHHHHHHHKPKGKKEVSSSSSSSSGSDSDSGSDEEDWWIEEMRRKQNHPHRLHKELWYNDPGELNYGPLCRCSFKSRKSGIRHDKYPGEQPIPKCDINSNNMDKLYHYKITVSPVTNYLTKHPTIIMFDGHEYMFEGFSIFTHKAVPELPPCQVIRFNIVYTIHMIEEQAPENFSVRSLDMLSDFLFTEILELVDIDWKGPGTEEHCRRFHVMPRFARPFPENGKEVLSMNDILLYLLKSSKPVIDPNDLPNLLRLDQDSWQKFVDSFRHMVVTSPGKKPSSIRIDQLDKQHCEEQNTSDFPLIIHHGLRPAQLSYAGDPTYKRKWREYMKFRHLIWCKTKPAPGDKEKLEDFEMELQRIRTNCTMKREVSVEIDSQGFLLTGIRSDICQQAMLLPVLFGHIRFHECLAELERKIGYTFKDRSLLHLAMTHSSYKINYGTNHDHGRNSMSNCGSRQREFGDQRALTQHTRKRGLNTLLRIMSKFGNKNETRSDIPHNERLEFLGDAVVEFITSIHLFYMFPFADEGEMTTYRGSLVQNTHLAVLAGRLCLQDFLLYAHGPDLCNESALNHAMANCFEALMGALFLDGGIGLADKVFSEALFQGESDLLEIWTNLPPHPLIQDEPNGDRHWVANSPALQKLLQFEADIGYDFKYIRLLAKSLTQPNVGYNHLTLGHNQRLEFLGDTIMQLISSNYLFRHFPDHHEGHLTLLRSSLVNNKTQAIVADELGLTDFVISSQTAGPLKMKQKERADLLEALFGAMYVDGGLEPCKIVCDVCIFPRLEQFILNQDWNDPKSQLQQCCLTLRDMKEESPAVPVYKVLKKSGPANTRRYTVGVYFRAKRLAVGEGGSIQQAEMEAAENALAKNKKMFPNRFRTTERLLKPGMFKIETDSVKKEDTD